MKKVAKKKARGKLAVKRAPGRPTRFSEKVLADICAELAKGTPMAVICRAEKMPAVRTVSDWVAMDKKVSASIARAREEGFDALAAECLEIADETSHDTISDDFGDKPNHEWITRSRLRIDTRLKLLSKWDPKRYGDKLDLEVKGDAVVKVVIGGDA